MGERQSRAHGRRDESASVIVNGKVLTPTPVCSSRQNTSADDGSSDRASDEKDSPGGDRGTTMFGLEGLGDERSRHGLRDGSGKAGNESSSSEAVEAGSLSKPNSARDIESPGDNVGRTATNGLGDGVPKKRSSTEAENTNADGVGGGCDGYVEGFRNGEEGLCSSAWSSEEGSKCQYSAAWVV